MIEQNIQSDSGKATALRGEAAFQLPYDGMLIGKMIDPAMIDQPLIDFRRQGLRVDAAGKVPQQVTDTGRHCRLRENKMGKKIHKKTGYQKSYFQYPAFYRRLQR